jgi:hypothetical protein
VQISLQDPAFKNDLSLYTEWNYWEILFLTLWRIAEKLYHFTFTSAMHRVLIPPPSSTTLVIRGLFSCLYTYPNECVRWVVFHGGLHLHLPDNWWWWASCSKFVGHLYVIFGEMSIHAFCSFFHQVIHLFPRNPRQNLFTNHFVSWILLLFPNLCLCPDCFSLFVKTTLSQQLLSYSQNCQLL